jgi:hypothetical protein
LDTEFLALSLVFILLGLTGIALFNGPSIDNGASCACIIPSPEPGAAQGTSSIILVLGLLFLPMGVLKGGLPSLGRGPTGTKAPQAVPAGPAYTPIPMASGGLFALGVLLVVVAVDALVVPGYLVFNSYAITGAGGALTALGVLAMYFGFGRRKGSD